jgi:hypothetical protein
MTATPPRPLWLVFVCERDNELVLGNIERLGVLGEFKLIWLNDVATLEEVGILLSLGRSTGGRGAGPGFIN